ncbi:DUF397 domain-containing protein [Streptomyces sp. NPDC050610]|uniref:DUF397 domain-containing protein n=1 Tax=Streptomyces sp. NPDC050610 TaxID=3157097 RepID=UPI00342A26C4
MNTEGSVHSVPELAWFKSTYSGGEGGACVEVAIEWRKSNHSGGAGGECVEVAADWSKSTHSSGEGGECVEVSTDWSKSSHSSGEGGACLEVRPCPRTVHVRDSKDKQGPQLAVTPAAWTAFVSYAATA